VPKIQSLSQKGEKGLLTSLRPFVRPSFYPNVSARLSMDGFKQNFILVTFFLNLPGNSKFGSSREKILST